MAEALRETPRDEFMERSIGLQAAGHVPIRERFTFRHRDFMHDLPDETPIMLKSDDGVKVPLLSNAGKPVTVGEVYPERADIALDDEGCIVRQNDFKERYKAFLEVTLPDFCRVDDEPIPAADRWIVQVVDSFSESPGPIDIGFDARKPAEQEATHMYNPETDELLERVAAQGEAQGAALTKALEVLTETVAKSKSGNRK